MNDWRCEVLAYSDVLERAFDDLALVILVVDDEVLRNADALAVGPEYTGPEVVERADGQFADALSEKRFETRTHFPCRFVGESHGEDAVRCNAQNPNEVGESVRDDAGFARPRPGDDKERPADRFDGIALLIVEIFEQAAGGFRGHKGGLPRIAAMDGLEPTDRTNLAARWP